MQLIDFINKRALELTMQTGMRYMDAKKFAMDTIIGARYFPNELVGEIATEYTNFMVDYNQYAEKMAEIKEILLEVADSSKPTT